MALPFAIGTLQILLAYLSLPPLYISTSSAAVVAISENWYFFPNVPCNEQLAKLLLMMGPASQIVR